MNETLKIAIISAFIIVVVAALISFSTKDRNSEKVSFAPIPNIDANEEYVGYSKDFKTYASKFGFSFQYPNHFSLKNNSTLDTSGHSEQLSILANVIDNKYDIYGVIISVSENSDGVSPLDWLKGPLGADLINSYSILDVDGQPAIFLNNETLIVVNTPDDKYRLKIELILAEDKEPSFNEIDMVVSSLRFVR